MKYPKFKILTEKEKKKIVDMLKEQFGVMRVDGLMLKRGAERIFLYTGNLSKKQVGEIEDDILVERVGIYFAKEQNNEIRLSIEGVQILKDQITKNIFELREDEAERWMLGEELGIQTGKKGFLIMKYKDDFLGCGKASELKIGNYIPKSRRLKRKE